MYTSGPKPGLPSPVGSMPPGTLYILNSHDYTLWRSWNRIDARLNHNATTQSLKADLTGRGYRIDPSRSQARHRGLFLGTTTPHIAPGEVVFINGGSRSAYVDAPDKVDIYLPAPGAEVRPVTRASLLALEAIHDQTIYRPTSSAMVKKDIPLWSLLWQGGLWPFEVWSKGPPPGGPLIVDAVPQMNDLVWPGNAVRGFGDLAPNEVNVWIPFYFRYAPPRQINKAKFTLRIRGNGDNWDNDNFSMRGADGKPHVVWGSSINVSCSHFQDITVVLDPANNPDHASVFQALRSGYVEGLIQDDTAVLSVRMELS